MKSKKKKDPYALKPCPFCGNNHAMWFDESLEHQAGVACHSCGAKIFRKHSALDAIKAWNRRAKSEK